MIRDKLSGDLKEAVQAKDAHRICTLRLIGAAIKDRDIAVRTTDNAEGVSDADILGILTKMVKQRQESVKAYEEGGQLDLAAQERTEIKIIQSYLPKQMNSAEVDQAVASAIRDLGATSVRDLGRIMAHLKARHMGRMDFTRAGAAIKDALR